MFKKSEKKPFQTAYFTQLSDYPNYAEVKSKCTGDTWMLKAEHGFITTYHKPRGQKKYHVQGRSATVASAVKKIQQHDTYVKRFRYAKSS